MNNQFAKNLKSIRKEHNLSQEQLAEELEVSRQAISKWESSAAYPEMDKIIALCEKFDLNIDDLLHKDIKEVQKEVESKKSINKGIDDFLSFITDTVNLFSSMKAKSKIKCLFEQILIILVLLLLSCIIISMGNMMFSQLFGALPFRIKETIVSALSVILTLFCIITGAIVFIHIFKVRYLDYFIKTKHNTDNKTIISEDDNNNPIDFKQNSERVIIRDPKHSEYNFFGALFKAISIIIKFFVLLFALFVSFILVLLLISFVLSFLVYKSGLFFIGLLLSIVSFAFIVVIILLISLNFIFNRKNEQRKIIYSFITAIIVLGCGIGIAFIGTLNFRILKPNENMLKEETKEFTMTDNLFFDFFAEKVTYVQSDIDNIKVEYKINRYYKSKVYIPYNNEGIAIFTECTDPIKLMKEFVNNINNKRIVSLDSQISDITIYASKENIEKIKNNATEYYNNQISYEERINYYMDLVDDLQSQNYEYEQKIQELYNQIEQYKNYLNINDIE